MFLTYYSGWSNHVSDQRRTKRTKRVYFSRWRWEKVPVSIRETYRFFTRIAVAATRHRTRPIPLWNCTEAFSASNQNCSWLMEYSALGNEKDRVSNFCIFLSFSWETNIWKMLEISKTCSFKYFDEKDSFFLYVKKDLWMSRFIYTKKMLDIDLTQPFASGV